MCSSGLCMCSSGLCCVVVVGAVGDHFRKSLGPAWHSGVVVVCVVVVNV